MPTSTRTTPSRPDRSLTVVVRRPLRSRAAIAWIDHPWLDWVATVALGLVAAWASSRFLPLDDLEPSTRFAVYAGLATALLAFVMVAFTPLAILVALGNGSHLHRLRSHDGALRRQFLMSTLALLGLATALYLLGAVDATPKGSATARTVAAFVAVAGACKILRLTQLFWAILTADSLDRSAS